MTVRFQRDPQRFTAAEINRWNGVADLAARQELQGRRFPTANKFEPSSRVAICKNTSGSDRDQYQTMAIDGLSWDLATDGSTDVAFELITADPDKPAAVLLEPIKDGEFGRAIIDGLALALVNGGSGDYATPDATSHQMEPATSGSVRLVTAPHATADRLLPVVLNVGQQIDKHQPFTWRPKLNTGYMGLTTDVDATDPLDLEVDSHTTSGEVIVFNSSGHYRLIADCTILFPFGSSAANGDPRDVNFESQVFTEASLSLSPRRYLQQGMWSGSLGSTETITVSVRFDFYVDAPQRVFLFFFINRYYSWGALNAGGTNQTLAAPTSVLSGTLIVEKLSAINLYGGTYP